MFDAFFAFFFLSFCWNEMRLEWLAFLSDCSSDVMLDASHLPRARRVFPPFHIYLSELCLPVIGH